MNLFLTQQVAIPGSRQQPAQPSLKSGLSTAVRAERPERTQLLNFDGEREKERMRLFNVKLGEKASEANGAHIYQSSLTKNKQHRHLQSARCHVICDCNLDTAERTNERMGYNLLCP